MVTLGIIVYAKEGQSFEQFKEFYETSHVPLVLKLAGKHAPVSYVRRYLKTPAKPGQPDAGIRSFSTIEFRDIEHLTEFGKAVKVPELAANTAELSDVTKGEQWIIEEVGGPIAA